MAGKAFNFSVDFAALDKMLGDLPKAMGKAVLRNALKKAAKPIAAAANNNAPAFDTIIATKAGGRRPRSKNSVFVFVGPVEPHAWLYEHGSAPRYHADGKYVGQMPANPFMRPAWDGNREKAFRILVAEIESQLMRTAARLAKRAEAGKLGKNATKALRG